MSLYLHLKIEFPFQIKMFSLPDYEGHRTIQITYNIPDGTQSLNHPNPGQRYTGGTRVAYLPDTTEGREVSMVCASLFS